MDSTHTPEQLVGLPKLVGGGCELDWVKMAVPVVQAVRASSGCFPSMSQSHVSTEKEEVVGLCIGVLNGDLFPSSYNSLAFTCWFSHQAMYQMMDQGVVKLIFSCFIGDKCTKTGWVICTCFQSIQVQKSSEYEWIGIPIYIVPHVTIGERSIWTFVGKVMSPFFQYAV